MLNSLPVRLIWHSFNWLTRFAIVATMVMAMLTALLIIMLRYWLLPNVEQFHDRIVASLANAIGNPVSIGRIESDWQGLQPHLSFVDVRVMDEQRESALVLPRIYGSLSWKSLFEAELQLSSLEIDRPELLIHRDAQGKIFIGGVAISKQGNDKDLLNWLLHQPSMVVRNALITWSDEQRKAPQLVLHKVNLRIESLFSHHRFALRAIPPAELAGPLDMRGDFYGASFDDLGAWSGQMFTQLKYIDVKAWRSWLDLPNEFNQGRGALRGWMNIENGRVRRIIADIGLRDVTTRLAEDAPEMTLLKLRGRVTWKKLEGGMDVSTRNLSMRLQNGVELQPTDLHFRTTKVAKEQPAFSEMSANQMQFESLAGIAYFLPLEAGLRTKLSAYAPRGKVSNLSVQWQDKPENTDSYTISKFKIKGKFENLALRQVGALPGFSGLSVDVDGNDVSGRLNINSRQMVLDAPGVMREPLLFATLTGQAGWQQKNGELLVSVNNAAVANDDLEGNLSGSYQTKSGTRGLLDMTVNLTRGDVKQAARYTPLVAVDKAGNDWLHDSLLAGQTQDLRIRIKGNLSDFPLDGKKDVILEIGGHAREVVLKFDDSWPRIENITGELMIIGNKLEVKSQFATIMDAHLQNVTVTLPDMMSADLPLEVKGEAIGASNTFLQYIQQSPVRGYIDEFTDGMSASGNGHLDLYLHVPLLGSKPTKVSGTLRVQDNEINLGEGVPLLKNTRGELVFTESGMQASGVSAEILGGAASIDVQTSAGGAVHATVRGRTNLDVLRKLYPHPLLNYLYGGAAWEADIAVVKKSAQLIINSNFQGLGSNLPQPFLKRPNETLPFRLEKRSIQNRAEVSAMSRVEGTVPSISQGQSGGAEGGSEGREVITAQLGKLLSARLVRRIENGAMVIRRGVINFGEGQLSRPSEAQRGRSGVWLTGNLAEFPLQEWGELLGVIGGAGGGGFSIAGADLVVGRLSGYGMHFDDLKVSAVNRSDGITAHLSSNALNGEVDWQPYGGGKLTARLQNLIWKEDNTTPQPKPDQPVQTASVVPGSLPELQISIENLLLEGKQIGRLELMGNHDGNDWRLRRFNIINPDGSLDGEGVWRGGQGKAKTQVKLLLQISDAGKILERSGYPNTVKGGSGTLSTDISWTGNPGEFNYATLEGSLKLDTSKGQFLKMDPGIGKLLGILSLQSLPKRIKLDFADVFSDGFQFDNINGNASIKSGVIDTQDFHINGSSAKVTMKGSADLNTETQNLRVQILPTLGDSVSMIGAFAGGPAVGIGSLIINKILGNPLDKLMSFEYNISGTWSDPKVIKVGETPVILKDPKDNQGK